MFAIAVSSIERVGYLKSSGDFQMRKPFPRLTVKAKTLKIKNFAITRDSSEMIENKNTTEASVLSALSALKVVYPKVVLFKWSTRAASCRSDNKPIEKQKNQRNFNCSRSLSSCSVMGPCA